MCRAEVERQAKEAQIFCSVWGSDSCCCRGESFTAEEGHGYRFLLESSQDVWRSRLDRLREINSSRVPEQSSTIQPISDYDTHLVGVLSL